MAEDTDSRRRLLRRLRLERRRFGAGTAHARGRHRPGGTGSPATRLRLQGRWRLRRGAQSRCARDAGSVGAVDVRAWCGAREQARDQVRGSQWPQRLVVASRRVRVPCRLAAAAHPQQRGGVRLGAGGWRNDARARRSSKSRSLPGRGVAERYRCATCASRTFRSQSAPRVAASSKAEGYEPEHALDATAATSWRSADAASPAWLSLDFGREHEYGGLVVDWAAAGAARAFEVQSSDDGVTWTTLRPRRRPRANALRLPAGRRLLAASAAVPARASAGGGPHEIRLLDVRPFDFSRSLADFFHAVAASEPRGHHPRWLHREQSYWTPAGIAGGTTAAILNEEGLLEPDRGSFSLEPFLHVDGELVTWADAEVTVSLAQGERSCKTRFHVVLSFDKKGELFLMHVGKNFSHDANLLLHRNFKLHMQFIPIERIGFF